VYCAFWESCHLGITRWEVPLPRLPGELDGLRIALISDIHVNPSRRDDYVARTLDAVAGLDAEAIMFTGDLLSGPPDRLSEYLDVFRQVNAPRGKYAVLGNHDMWCGRSGAATAFLREAQWQMLRNQNAPLPETGGRTWIAGVDDPVTENEDLDAALTGVPDDAVCVLLSHTPDLIEPAAAAGVDLMLAGHTHGGQVVLPFVGPPVVPSKYGARYAWGLFDHQGTRMAVTRGVGMIAPRIRFRCRPEIVLLTLRRGQGNLSKGGPERDFRPQVRRLRDGVRSLRKLGR
jgi:predicted MPP superfamily phosphohydrolase